VNLDIEPIRVRLRRVEEQIRLLEADYGHFAHKLDDYGLNVESNDDDTEHVERIQMDWSIPEWWAVGIGEIVHNLRSSLDNLVWQLVIANGHAPGNQHEFLIAEEEAWYDRRSPAKLLNVPEAALAVIQHVQPFKVPRELQRGHPLWIVHNLSRIDKHHLLHVVAAYPGRGEFEVTPEMAAVQGGKMRLWYRPLADGTEVRTFFTLTPFHGIVPVGKVVPLEVVVMETDEMPFFDFPGILRQIAEGVTDTIDGIVAAVGG
jgi:hypothetical protein